MGRGVLPLWEVDIVDRTSNRPVRSYVMRGRREQDVKRRAYALGYVAAWQRVQVRPALSMFPTPVGGDC